LRVSAGWRPVPDKQAVAGLENNTLLVVAKNGEQTVGIARLITDGGHSAFIEDVLVLPEYQRCGIGKTMITKTLEHLRSQLQPDEWCSVVLISARGKEYFYKSPGFPEYPNENAGTGRHLGLDATRPNGNSLVLNGVKKS
jgi:GNAT superfamily N-acetyltransferase